MKKCRKGSKKGSGAKTVAFNSEGNNTGRNKRKHSGIIRHTDKSHILYNKLQTAL